MQLVCRFIYLKNIIFIYYLDVVYEDLNHADKKKQEWKQPVNQAYT